MDIEKMVEHIHRCAYSGDYPVVGSWAAIIDKKHLREWADALTALLAENEKLRAELEQKSKLIAQQAAELERRDTLLKEQEAEAALRREKE